MYTLKKDFRMSKRDIEFLNSLPDNLPGTKLTKKQIDQVSAMYYKYIRKIDNLDWNPALFEMELKEIWPSGPRVKHHEAKRMILDNLKNQPKKLTNNEAAKKFRSAMTCRASYIRLIDKIYDYGN